MKRLSIQLVTIFSFICAVCMAQNAGFTPVNLGTNINTAEYDEFNAVLSPDGKTMYFNRANHPENNYGKNKSQDVWTSELQSDGTWGVAKRLDNYINKGRYNAVLGITSDGTIFVTGKITKGGIRYKNGITVLKRTGDEFSDPENLFIPKLKRMSEGRVFSATPSSDGNHLIFAITRSFNAKRLKLYHTEYRKGGWSRLKTMKRTLNGGGNLQAPFLSEDNNTLYFAAKRSGGKGNYDIYKSTRTGGGWDIWTEPVLAFPDTVSSPEYESYFKVYGKKGNIGYFTSTNKSLGKADIFKVKLFEVQPYILLTGAILNKNTGLKFTDNKEYSVLVNGLKSDSVKINYDSTTYAIKLPFNKKYTIMAGAKNYNSVPVEFDATNISEYVEKKIDLMLEPLPYSMISGTFLDKATGLAIPGTANPKLILNGSVVDSAKIDLGTSKYSIKLPNGKDYTLGMQANKYKTISDTLNLTNVKAYKEFNKPLYGEKIPDPVAVVANKAIITGKVLNKKTMKPIESTVPYNVVVDGRPDLVASLNPATSEYTIEAAPGASYVVSAKAEKFYPISEVIDLSKEKTNVKIIKDLVIAPIEVGQTIRINNIYFETGKAILKPNSFPELDKLVKFLKENPTIFVEIAGHTDNVGKPEKNLLLSKNRAKAVEQYLEKNGIASDHVTFTGYGSAKPMVANKTPWGKAQNRRVEFVIKGI